MRGKPVYPLIIGREYARTQGYERDLFSKQKFRLGKRDGIVLPARRRA